MYSTTFDLWITPEEYYNFTDFLELDRASIDEENKKLYKKAVEQIRDEAG